METLSLMVTGHRPNKLDNAYEIMHPLNVEIGKEMRKYILEQAGFNKVTRTFQYVKVKIISGMAIGVDTIWALVAIRLKEQFPDIFELECAIPCANHSSRWNTETQKKYKEILSKADKVTHVSTAPYAPQLMQERNVYMVKNADKVLAVWDGTKGGTGNCVEYALKQSKDISIYHPFEKTWTYHSTLNI